MKTLKVEVWQSDNNQEEIHIFDASEANTYLCGFNPKIFNAEDRIDIMEILEFHGYNTDPISKFFRTGTKQ